jgi:hypothetical protein
MATREAAVTDVLAPGAREPLTDLLASLLRGDPLASTAWATLDADAFCRAADAHGVLPLIAQRWREGGDGPPDPLSARIADLARQEAAADLAREAELRAALAALDRAGVRPIVFKGAHLAYRDYARPDLRPRADSDVLVPADASARNAAHAVLTSMGYVTAPHVGGDLVMTQRMYVKREGSRVAHALDLHWRVATPQAFARVLIHGEIAQDAEDLPRLDARARGPAGPHALIIACIHRIAHHAGSDRLIWLWDIDRISRRLSAGDWQRFATLVRERRVSAVCAESLRRAQGRFHTPVRAELGSVPQAADPASEVSARYFEPPSDSVTAALEDVRALSSWRDRSRLVREHLLPPAAYMREVYAPASRAPLVWLYLRRVSAGVRKWFTASAGR